MQISVSGKNMDMGNAFQEHAQTSLNAIVEKYFHNAVSGHVTLEKADSGFTVKTRIALARRIEFEATGRAVDAHAALDVAIDHAEKRLRRHKRRLKNHRNPMNSVVENEGMNVPITAYAPFETVISSEALEDEEEKGNDAGLPIVADLSYDIDVLTVEQAVMRIELSGETMLMFRNAGHFGLNVVHRRNDGNIGWIDPRGTRHLTA